MRAPPPLQCHGGPRWTRGPSHPRTTRYVRPLVFPMRIRARRFVSRVRLRAPSSSRRRVAPNPGPRPRQLLSLPSFPTGPEPLPGRKAATRRVTAVSCVRHYFIDVLCSRTSTGGWYLSASPLLFLSLSPICGERCPAHFISIFTVFVVIKQVYRGHTFVLLFLNVKLMKKISSCNHACCNWLENCSSSRIHNFESSEFLLSLWLPASL